MLSCAGCMIDNRHGPGVMFLGRIHDDDKGQGAGMGLAAVAVPSGACGGEPHGSHRLPAATGDMA